MTQNINRLRGGGGGVRKRKRASSRKPRKQKSKRTKITKRKSSKHKASKTIKRDILVIRISRYPMSGDIEFVTTEFDIFAHKPVKKAILETNAVHYKPIATVDQNDLEFLIPADETYIDLDIKIYVKCKLIGADGKDLDATDYTAGTNNFLHSVFNIASHSTERTSRRPQNCTPTCISGEPPDLRFRRGQLASYKYVLVSGRRTGRLTG